MFKMLKRASTHIASLAAVFLATATPAFSQAPTDAQRDAIRSACRADYQAHCSSVTPGGAEALQCLQKNMTGLSAACQDAVRAIEPPPAPKAESVPAAPKAESAPAAPGSEAAKPAGTTAAPKAAASTAAGQPTSTEVAAIRSACRSDYPKVCPGVPTGGAPALQCLEKNKSKLSPACAKAVSAAAGGGASPTAAAPAAGAPATAPAAAPSTIVLRPLRPREELLIARSACSGDIRTVCAGVALGGGRVARCLAANAASLSPACREVLAQFAGR